MKRITLFAGHYGSGKTNIAVNYALHLAGKGLPVTVADLDIVNPYFRTKDSEKEFAEAGIELICSGFANTNVDLPALPQGIYSVIDRPDRYAILDIGGDDRGAYALGRIADGIKAEGNYEMLFVANFYRPLTRTPEEALEVMREIELAGKINFTGIINNSNIGEETTPDDVARTADKAAELGKLSGLPVVWTTVKETLYSSMQNTEGLFPLRLQEKIT
ncbi:MAG: hypothetical protein IKV47_02905 [Oscillospiraceae bacterium]|nr:hypothetical protein [Oscillospiraceae bacterium]MBR5261102.1 hypothetical protein [Oscillospiraceae bacterium]